MEEHLASCFKREKNLPMLRIDSDGLIELSKRIEATLHPFEGSRPYSVEVSKSATLQARHVNDLLDDSDVLRVGVRPLSANIYSEPFGARRLSLILDRHSNLLKVEGVDAVWVNGTFEVLRNYLGVFRPRYAVAPHFVLAGGLGGLLAAGLGASIPLLPSADDLPERFGLLLLWATIVPILVANAAGRVFPAYRFKSRHPERGIWTLGGALTVLGSVASVISLILGVLVYRS